MKRKMKPIETRLTYKELKGIRKKEIVNSKTKN
jgi:hypothetical protein